jgi:hypothetical protein
MNIISAPLPQEPLSSPSSSRHSDSGDKETRRRSEEISVFRVALSLFAFKYNVSRQMYASLIEILHLAPNVNALRELLRDVRTLKAYLKRCLPLLKMRHRKIPLQIRQLPTMRARDKARANASQQVHALEVDVFWFDPPDLIRRLLSTPGLTSIMHYGFAEYVDNPHEL